MGAIPRWYTALSQVCSENPKFTNYALASIDITRGPPVPRVRNLVHRSFLCSSAQLPLLVSTTDIRTPKVKELLSISGSSDPNAELCWWIADALEQWRISGKLHILPHPDHPLLAQFPAQRLAPKEDEDGSDFEWEKERLKTFNEKMGGALRAWFAHELAPGSILESYDDVKQWPSTLPKSYEVEKGDEKTQKHMEEALKNFALLVMEPMVVERLEFTPIPNHRTKYERVGENWKETIIAP
ncbi:hypothetical protein FRB96_008381 [Tulasnella sp. 330]|nr:hypothetical protein FRB96_008381 [Tulasnella sp. 330]KAG8879758.1 hypothetical protein FRB97_001454 [Tulasnella sp. 331]KAG8886100.1 hypothetical protein FRB98_001474 [Tulasnella sp. 332]